MSKPKPQAEAAALMAHSLGNMVVSSMIQDHGLQVSR